MRSRWTAFLSVAWVILLAPALCGQSLLEQLEKKVRDGLELTAPQTTPQAASAAANQPSNTNAGNAGPKTAAGDAELPPPNRKTPPPPPTPSLSVPGKSAAGAGRVSASILEPPDTSLPSLQPAAPQPEGSETGSSIYLGLDAESQLGGGIGARVVSVTENSPAWRSGFKVNDVILAIDGYAIANLDTMVERLALRRPGETIKFLVLRSGRNTELTAVLQDAAIARRVQGQGTGSPLLPAPLPNAEPAWMGLVVADLSTAFRNQFGLRAYRAAAVTNVTKGSPADLANIRPGDAIIAVDQQSIESARQLLDWMLTKRPGERANLSVMRGTRTSTVEITLGNDPKALPPLLPRAPQPEVFSAQSPGGGVLVEAADNSVPLPPGESSTSSVEQLRGELRAARQQLTALEQRIAELENQLNKPQ